MITIFSHLCTLKRLAELKKQRLYLDPVAFYDFFTNRVLVQFKPLHDDMATTVEFDLLLSNKLTYDQMASQVGERLQHDPMKLQFTSSHQGNPKDIIRRTAAQGTLADMIQSSYKNAPNNVLFYELLDMSIKEIETKRNVKVTWTGAHNGEKVGSYLCEIIYQGNRQPLVLMKFCTLGKTFILDAQDLIDARCSG
jgi:ubiquitin carboxyl-terminal hydrolase 7